MQLPDLHRKALSYQVSIRYPGFVSNCLFFLVVLKVTCAFLAQMKQWRNSQ